MKKSLRDPAVIEAKRAKAQRATDAFAQTLIAEQFPSYAESYRAIVFALEIGDLERAVELERAIPKSGMGSLSDIYPDDEQRWQRAFSEASHSIADLRVYLSYGIHAQRPNDNNRNA